MAITNSRVWINRVRLPILLVVKINIPLSPCVPENLVSRDGFSRPVPRQPAHLHTQAESGAYLRDPSRVPRRRPFMKPPYAIRSVPSLSGHAITYRWRSLPRVRRHRANKPHGSSEQLLLWQITMDQLIFASLSHTHYWYEVGMLKVPVVSCGTRPSSRVRARTPPVQHFLCGSYELGLHAFQGGQRHHGRFGTPEEEKGGGGAGGSNCRRVSPRDAALGYALG